MSTLPCSLVYCDFIDELFNDLSVNESFHHLFSFIGRHIPFDRAICSIINRNEKTLSAIVDYSMGQHQFVTPYTNLLGAMFSLDEIKIFFNEDNQYIHINNCLKAPNREREYILANFREYYTSLISIAVDLDEVKNTIFTLSLFSQKRDMYTRQHGDLLTLFRDPLNRILNRFFRNADEPCLVLSGEGPARASSEELLRRCKGLRQVMRQVDAVADKDTAVLLLGQSGSGKELVAETLHARSTQARGPFVAVNCGAIPESLLDSELFGHEKGAFTGAYTATPGYFEQARGGTIYLDEIGELSPQAQARLLRVLETGEVRRVGGNRRIPVNARIIAATNRDLAAMAETGTFRPDLWYRLNVFPIAIPSLAQRLDDIPVLTEYFYQYYVDHHRLTDPPRLSRKLMLELAARHWPGNVRELRCVLERALLTCQEARSSLLHLTEQDQTIHNPVAALPCSRRGRPGLNDDLRTATRKAVAACGGRISGPDGAAVLLGVTPNTVRNRLKNPESE